MDEVSEDRLLDGRVLLRQPVQGFRVAIDSVLLAAAVPAADGEMVFDLGAGVGAAALCLAARVGGCRVFGLEPQPPLVGLARQNIDLNRVTGRVEIMIGTLAAPPPRLAPGSFHHVMTNPPFHPDSGTPSPDPGRDLANRESGVSLVDWMRFALVMLRPRGTLVAIYRADRLDDLLSAVHGKVGDVDVIPLWPKIGRPAKRVLVRACKGAQGPLTLHPGLVLHEEDGRYTAPIEAILRRVAPLS